MEKFRTIKPELDGAVVTLWLSRPEVHNALNGVMIREILSFFSKIEEVEDISVVIIRGQGNSFCSGADLHWMKNSFQLDEAENLKESRELSEMFGAIFRCSKIVVAAVHGNVFGGGNGLVAASDLAYCINDSRFSLSETRIGMVAASVTPYLLQKMKAIDLKELVFTAKSFNADEAVKYGLLNQSLPSQDALDHHVNELISQILANGKQALVASKQLINRISIQSITGVIEQIPGLLAKVRVSPEAQEGFTAFLEKRKPNW